MLVKRRMKSLTLSRISVSTALPRFEEGRTLTLVRERSGGGSFAEASPRLDAGGRGVILGRTGGGSKSPGRGASFIGESAFEDAVASRRVHPPGTSPAARYPRLRS